VTRLTVSVPVLDFKPVGPKALRADPSTNVAVVVEIFPPKRAQWAVGMGAERVGQGEVTSTVSTLDAIETAKKAATKAWLTAAGLKVVEVVDDVCMCSHARRQHHNEEGGCLHDKGTRTACGCKLFAETP
jgi:hypothetical protein